MFKKMLSKLKHDWDFYYSWLFINAHKLGQRIEYLEKKYGKEYTKSKLQ